MPIDFFQTPDGIHVKQSFDSPTVYLDHWAIRLFSDDLELQDRFVNALMSKDGTLLLSYLSFGEFARATDSRHCHDAEAFLERLLPNIFLTDFSFDKVLEQELTEPNNQKRFWPSEDLPLLKFFVERAQSAKLGFTMHGFITLAHVNRVEISKTTNIAIRMLLDSLEKARGDPSYVVKARNTHPNDARTRTFVILGELLRCFNLDSTAPISENDAIDLLHAAMPVNCCDYILLDGPWAERVEKMRQRMVKAATNMPIARCFSKRGNGITAFLVDLEAFVKPV